jgi:amino acid adenylation domain-containing protein
MTYAELGAKCAGLTAAILDALGDNEEPVASLFDQGTPAIATMLGVLTAGKILVPLDPAFPRERIEYMIRDTGARLIVTDARHLSMASSLCDAGFRILDIDAQQPRAIGTHPRVRITADTIASIHYTSGSTGQPKGVTQNHRNLLHTVMNYTNVFHVCADDRIASFTSPAGIALVWMSLVSLLNGASYYAVNVKEHAPLSLAEWLDEQGVTVLSAMPPVYRVVVNGLPAAFRFAHVRVVGLGGDSLHANDVELFRRHFSEDCLLSPGLGLTETGRVTYHLMDARSLLVDGHVPIGYPAEGMEVLLLDEDGRKASADGVGEIVIRSAFLSPGYWRRPDLSRRAFLPDPSGGLERVYYTGDLARQLPDGCLVHLGRKDLQVKIRGHRVELPEVEAALLSLPGIVEAVAVAHANSEGEKRVVAYVVQAARPAISASELRNALGTRLPQHMIPWRFVTLDALPLTVMGKVDRGALPPPAPTRLGLTSSFAAPRTPTESALVNIWTEVLDLDQVGIHDTFLELGGDSLKAMHIASRISTLFQIEFPLSIVFELATIAELADELDEALHRPGARKRQIVPRRRS